VLGSVVPHISCADLCRLPLRSAQSITDPTASTIPNPRPSLPTALPHTQAVPVGFSDRLLTIGIVILVVLLFLRNFWATVIPGVTIPLALLGSFGAMYLLNFSINNLSLMALTIAIGFVVDDAIVVVENIYRYLEEGLSPLEAALKGSREIAFTVLSISLSLVAAFIPLLLMGGLIGRIFREFALTVTASIVVSVVVSLTLAPMLSSRCMKYAPAEHGRLFRAI
jgi:multidrug efflux pump subunit AcrB